MISSNSIKWLLNFFFIPKICKFKNSFLMNISLYNKVRPMWHWLTFMFLNFRIKYPLLLPNMFLFGGFVFISAWEKSAPLSFNFLKRCSYLYQRHIYKTAGQNHMLFTKVTGQMKLSAGKKRPWPNGPDKVIGIFNVIWFGQVN